tara:strand:- start:174 stop:356 length:183 start_codon:yes stop_codon:yes gene_type:complete
MKYIENCNNCGRGLNPDKIVWLELSNSDGQYYDPEKFPPSHLSQGAFAFGSACAKKELKK